MTKIKSLTLLKFTSMLKDKAEVQMKNLNILYSNQKVSGQENREENKGKGCRVGIGDSSKCSQHEY